MNECQEKEEDREERMAAVTICEKETLSTLSTLSSAQMSKKCCI